MTHLIKTVCLLSLLALGAQAAAQQKPNVIFILADDLGWAFASANNTGDEE